MYLLAIFLLSLSGCTIFTMPMGDPHTDGYGNTYRASAIVIVSDEAACTGSCGMKGYEQK